MWISLGCGLVLLDDGGVMATIIFWSLIGMNLCIAIGWILCKRFGTVDKLMRWVDENSND